MLKWLFDSTYILPWFGINVNIPHLKESLKEVLASRTGEIAVTSCSLIEGKWKAIRAYQKENNPAYLERSNKALQAFAVGRYFQVINPWEVPEVSSLADELLKQGHNDYMDCWIAGTAKNRGVALISEDDDLRQLISTISTWSTLNIINWNEFLSQIKLEI
jgi:predicted nucleic acid-binding protein